MSHAKQALLSLCLLPLGACIFAESSTPSGSNIAITTPDMAVEDMRVEDQPSDMTPQDDAGQLPPDMDVPDLPLDMEMGADMDMDADMGQISCGTDEELCTERSLACGEQRIYDRCNNAREVDCGGCESGFECDTNICVCVSPPDAQVCSDFQLECGVHSIQDICGKSRTVTCGTCGEQKECSESGTCIDACVPISMDDLCSASNIACGEYSPESSIDNGCGEELEEIYCGTCGPNQKCDSSNQCQCVPETAAELCVQENATCGEISVVDRCGVMHTFSCGTCSDGMCENNTCSQCESPSDETLCIQNNAFCGDITVLDSCTGAARTVNCDLTRGCSEDELCTVANQCECPLPLCGDEDCGVIRNACGQSIDCGQGSCGEEEVCGNDNECVCPTPQCPTGAECGLYTNACGKSIMCGMCGSGEVCDSNQCQCEGESEAELCTLANASCGIITVQDRCGTARTVNCGTCSEQYDDCQNNMCVCIAESDCELCTANDAQTSCGTINNLNTCVEQYVFIDRCNQQRTVQCCNNGIIGLSCTENYPAQCPAQQGS